MTQRRTSFTDTNAASGGEASLLNLPQGLGKGWGLPLMGLGSHSLGITKTRSNTLTYLRESLGPQCHLSVSQELNSVVRHSWGNEQVSLPWQNLVKSWDLRSADGTPSKTIGDVVTGLQSENGTLYSCSNGCCPSSLGHCSPMDSSFSADIRSGLMTCFVVELGSRDWRMRLSFVMLHLPLPQS